MKLDEWVAIVTLVFVILGMVLLKTAVWNECRATPHSVMYCMFRG
jgi:hypothetical protein